MMWDTSLRETGGAPGTRDTAAVPDPSCPIGERCAA